MVELGVRHEGLYSVSLGDANDREGRWIVAVSLVDRDAPAAQPRCLPGVYFPLAPQGGGSKI